MAVAVGETRRASKQSTLLSRLRMGSRPSSPRAASVKAKAVAVSCHDKPPTPGQAECQGGRELKRATSVPGRSRAESPRVPIRTRLNALLVKEQSRGKSLATPDDSCLQAAFACAAVLDESVQPSQQRVIHFSLRQGHKPNPMLAALKGAATCEDMTMEGGATTVACELQNQYPELRIGLMVAANSGRPGGACGCKGEVAAIHHHHTTQEEDIFSNWILTEAGRAKKSQDRLYQDTIFRQWGLVEADSRSLATLQGVDYVNTADPSSYADAWVVRDASVSLKSRKGYDLSKKVLCDLIFCAGPNAGARSSPTGSTNRTLNRRAHSRGEYRFFQECLANSLRAALDAMICEGVRVAIVARMSCGIYAGPHREAIIKDFNRIVDAVLQEPVLDSDCARGQFFVRVVVPLLP